MDVASPLRRDGSVGVALPAPNVFEDDSDDAPLAKVVHRTTLKKAKTHEEQTGRPSASGTKRKGERDDVKEKTKSKKQRKSGENDVSGRANGGDDDDDDDTPLAVMSKAKQKSVPVKKEPIQHIDDDDDDDDVPLARQLLASKTKKEKEKEKKKISKSHIDDSDDDVPLARQLSAQTEQKKKKTMKKERKEGEREKQINKHSQSVVSGGSVPVPKVKKEKKVKKEEETPTTSGHGKRKEPEGTQPSPTKPKRQAVNKEEESAFKWWEGRSELPEGHRWRTLEWNGVVFPPKYEPHNVKMLYNGKPVDLSPDSEELATFYASVVGTDWAKNDTFNTNFFSEFISTLNVCDKNHPIHEFSLCDFTPIHAWIMEQKEKKKNRSKEEKEKEKQENKKLVEKFGFAVIDGVKEKIGNFKVEPPGLFRGRGAHPLTGILKTRIQPEDVTINIGEGARIPSPPPGRQWKAVVHNHEVTWLAFWVDSICNSNKYIFLAPGSRFRGESDMDKFEKARELKLHIKKIRSTYTKELEAGDSMTRQRATALALIDQFAFRVGGEKGDDEADTVGCCSLRVEHVQLQGDNQITFDFLGKDSIRYYQTHQVPERVYHNIKRFCRGKSSSDKIFHELTTTELNRYLKGFMDGLSAKVFRTYNASITLQKLLKELEEAVSECPLPSKLVHYNDANHNVAVLCNHQRSVPKSHEKSLETLNSKIGALEEEEKELRRVRKRLKRGETVMSSQLTKTATAVKPKGEQEKPSRKPVDRELKLDQIEVKLRKLAERIHHLRSQSTIKDKNKNISLTTSRINYLDPRITVAWCRKHDVPIEKIFSLTLRDKFKWALGESKDFEF